MKITTKLITCQVNHANYDLVSFRRVNALEATEKAYEENISLSNYKKVLGISMGKFILIQGANEPRNYAFVGFLSPNVIAWKLDN
jgi:hypothetical protein